MLNYCVRVLYDWSNEEYLPRVTSKTKNELQDFLMKFYGEYVALSNPCINKINKEIESYKAEPIGDGHGKINYHSLYQQFVNHRLQYYVLQLMASKQDEYYMDGDTLYEWFIDDETSLALRIWNKRLDELDIKYKAPELHWYLQPL